MDPCFDLKLLPDEDQLLWTRELFHGLAVACCLSDVTSCLFAMTSVKAVASAVQAVACLSVLLLARPPKRPWLCHPCTFAGAADAPAAGQAEGLWPCARHQHVRTGLVVVHACPYGGACMHVQMGASSHCTIWVPACLSYECKHW